MWSEEPKGQWRLSMLNLSVLGCLVLGLVPLHADGNVSSEGLSLGQIQRINFPCCVTRLKATALMHDMLRLLNPTSAHSTGNLSQGKQ